MMTLRYTFMLLLMLTCIYLPAHSQTDSLKERLLAADTVELLSHQDLYVTPTYEAIKHGAQSYHRSIGNAVTGRVNDSIVVERLALNNALRDSLVGLLSKSYPNEMPTDRNSCFMPHQTIVLYSKGKCFFMDICFDCRQFAMSENVLLPKTFLATNIQWQELKDFFIANGIGYKISLKPNK